MSTEETPIVSMAQFADAFDISYDATDPVASLPVTLEQARRYVQSLNTSEPILPDGYTQLEYLESKGSQYINLGFGFQGSDDVEIDFQMTQAPTSAEGIFGGRDTSSVRGYMLYAEARTDGFVFMHNNTYITNINNDWYDRHVFKKTGSNIYFDGVANSQTVSASFTQTRTALIFSWRNEGAAPVNSKSRIFSFTVTRSGAKYCELVPAKRDSDSVLGMYDIVRNTFLTNSGTGTFVAGPAVAQTFDDFPQDFTKLEYIESNGSQALDTDYTPNSDTRVVLDYKLTKLITNDWSGMFGARDSSAANAYAYWADTNGKYRSDYSTEGSLFGKQNTNRHTVDKNKNVLKEDGVVVSTNAAATFSSNFPMYLFCGNHGGSPMHYANMRLYSCKIYNDDVLVRDYVPVKRKRDSSIGLYDKVNRVFYTSITTSNFVSGPEISSDLPDVGGRILTLAQLKRMIPTYNYKYELLEYISLSGRQYVDTGFYPTNGSRVVCKVYLEPTQIDGAVSIYGGRTNAGVNSLSLWRTGASTFRQDFGSRTQNISLSTAGTFEIDNNGNSITINKTSSTISYSASFSSTHTLKISANYTSGTSDGVDNRGFTGKLYYFKFSNDGTLIRDYVPVKRISDGAIGLYDKVNGLFYENNGTGSFGAGPEVGYV